MLRPRRRLIAGIVAVACLIFGAVALNVAWNVKRAADDVRVMMVPTVELPPEPTATPEQAATAVPGQPAARSYAAASHSGGQRQCPRPMPQSTSC